MVRIHEEPVQLEPIKGWIACFSYRLDRDTVHDLKSAKSIELSLRLKVRDSEQPEITFWNRFHAPWSLGITPKPPDYQGD